MNPQLSAADRVEQITQILCGSVFRLGDGVGASTTQLSGAEIEGPGTIVESRTYKRNPPFPYRYGKHMAASVLVRYDAPPHDSGVNNGIWTSPRNMRHL